MIEKNISKISCIVTQMCYICGNSTRIASRQISLRVFPKRQLFTKDNTPPMPLSDAHLGGLFFLGHE